MRGPSALLCYGASRPSARPARTCRGSCMFPGLPLLYPHPSHRALSGSLHFRSPFLFPPQPRHAFCRQMNGARPSPVVAGFPRPTTSGREPVHPRRCPFSDPSPLGEAAGLGPHRKGSGASEDACIGGQGVLLPCPSQDSPEPVTDVNDNRTFVRSSSPSLSSILGGYLAFALSVPS